MISVDYVWLLPLLPLLLLALPIFAVVLRIHERRDGTPPHIKQEQDRILELAALEDHLVQNPFMAVGHVKPGKFRLLTLSAVLIGLNFTTRHIFNRGSLSGVKTIHFARWVFLDGKRRMFFASNYDGSMESYMDDFIDKVAWGLNLVFSNGIGYPKTRWLVFGGARDELAFKDYLRVHQVPTRVWHSAYGDLTALNIKQNERIRAGLCHDTFSARQGVEDDDMNILTLGARIIGPLLAIEVIQAFLKAQFSGAERHMRRLNKVKGFEDKFGK